jgi:Trypsin-like peptidase domain
MTTKRLRSSCSILAALAIVLCGARAADAQRAIPDDNLAYPVLIHGKADMASGFYLNNATATFLVTAKHVLFDLKTNKLIDSQLDLLSYSKNPSESGRCLLTLDLAVLDKAGNVKADPSEDVALIKIATFTGTSPSGTPAPVSNATQSTPPPRMMQFVAGVTMKENTANGIVGVSLDNVKTFAQVLVGNDIFVFGYPSSLGLQELPQLDLLHPLLRKGIVAGENINSRSIVLDCPVYQGNSGGPVLEADHQGFGVHFSIIGVVIQSVPYADLWVNARQHYVNTTLLNSGYSIAAPMDAVLKLAN